MTDLPVTEPSEADLEALDADRDRPEPVCVICGRATHRLGELAACRRAERAL